MGQNDSVGTIQQPVCGCIVLDNRHRKKQDPVKLSCRLLAVAIAPLFFAEGTTAQNFPVADRQLYDFFENLPVDRSLIFKNTAGMAKSGGQSRQRPDHVNNQATNHFPPIFNQSGGSCGSSANVAYMLCYEINSLHNRDGKHNADYQFPSHFSWLACNSALPEETITRSNGIPSVTTYGGTTYSRFFGLQDTEEKDWGWMQGYDKWYSAMFNRSKSMGKFPYGMDTPEGIELAKNWLWNHCGDEDFQTGGIFVIGVAAGPEFTEFPDTPANQEAGVIGHHYVTTWGPQYNHAMTVVGYDDRVEFDLDGNGISGEKDKGETGAWIIANSWGTGWCDAGTIYCPYAYTYCVGLSGSAWDPAVYHPRKNYRPLRTIKLLMDHSRRYEIGLCGGVSQDTSSQEPEFTTKFSHFSYSGSVKTGTADVPMLGRWADGYHYEPMEFGYDLTDLTENVDRTKPLKYFFYITTKYSAKGVGNIYKASILDYEFERNGMEIPFRVDTVAILNKGKTTMISVIVPGEQAYPPVNLQLAEQKLSWQAPRKSNLQLKGYAVYCNDKQIALLDAGVNTYDLGSPDVGPYALTAVYDYHGQDNESAKTNSVYNISASVAEKTNTVLELRNSMLSIPDAIPSHLNETTIEFWIKPFAVFSYNQQIGQSWGTFLFHTDNSGAVVVGWNTGADRITSASGMLKTNEWTHIAVTVNGNVMTLYVNGNKKGSVTSANYSGLDAIRNFKIGESAYKFNGQIDELRIWNRCCTQGEILVNMRQSIVNPTICPGLITYLNMDTVQQNGITTLLEYRGGHSVDLSTVSDYGVVEDATFLTGSISAFGADFTLSANTLCVGEPVSVYPSFPLCATGIEWQADGSNTPGTTISTPSFAYGKAGKYSISLKVYDSNGNSAEKTKEITVKKPEAPVANFELSVDSISAGNKISLINRSVGENCTFAWSMPGADTEAVSTTNASPSFLVTGRHPVTLTASNETETSSITKYITVTNTLPAIDFNVTPAAIILGEKVSLSDRTKYEPSKWTWTVTNDRHNTIIRGQDYAYTPKHPGVYDVSLTATNDVGTSTSTLKRAFMVSNADPKNGLNFTGKGERVSFKSPVSTTLKGFTVEYWLFPYSTSGAANLVSDDGVFKTTTGSNGETSITLNNKTVSSGEGFVIPNEWHHYAIVCKSGSVVFYRDGEMFIQPAARLPLKVPVWTGNVTMGSTDNPFFGMIDEFRFWNTPLSAGDIQSVCNAPISNPDSMKTNAGLVIYYDFNQASGNVKSLTGDEFLGTRLGFGPDGDAWTSSLGVFTLDFSERTIEKDVTADCLTNSKAPFSHSSTNVNATNYVARFWELETGTASSKWVVENTVSESDVTTGAHVDSYSGGALACTTGNEGFAQSVNDQRIYQTVILPSGHYKLSVTPYGSSFAETGSYLVVNKGDTLVGNGTLRDAIAWSRLDDKELEFDVTEDGAEISLGVIFNMDKNNTVAIEAFTLTRYPCEFIDAEDMSAVTEIVNADKDCVFFPEHGGIRSGGGWLEITSLQGITIFAADTAEGLFVKLPSGIYIVNGKKTEIR